MKSRELEGNALDYWCARALVDDKEEVLFIRTEPTVVVTLSHGAMRKLAQPFSPAQDWTDAIEVLERARELQWTRAEQGARCAACFGDAARSEADGPNPRVALLRAFVQARFGDSVEAYPANPHAVREGRVHPYDAGGVPPTYGDVAGTDSEIGNIRSVPRP
jgi:hypothetical protein